MMQLFNVLHQALVSRFICYFSGDHFLKLGNFFPELQKMLGFTHLTRCLLTSSPVVPSGPWRGFECLVLWTGEESEKFIFSSIFQNSRNTSVLFKVFFSPCAFYISWRSFLQWVHSLLEQEENRSWRCHTDSSKRVQPPTRASSGSVEVLTAKRASQKSYLQTNTHELRHSHTKHRSWAPLI